MLSVTIPYLQDGRFLGVVLHDETSLEFATSIFPSTAFRERSNLMASALDMTRCQQTGQAQNVATCTYS